MTTTLTAGGIEGAEDAARRGRRPNIFSTVVVELAGLLHGAARLIDGLRADRAADSGHGGRELYVVDASHAIHVALVATGVVEGADAPPTIDPDRLLAAATGHGARFLDASAGEAEPGQQLEAVACPGPEAVVVLDDLDRIGAPTPPATLRGYDPEELVGEPIEVLVPLARLASHTGHLEECFEAPRARLIGAGLDLIGRHRDGTELAGEVGLAPVDFRGASRVATFVRHARERQRGADLICSRHESLE